MSLLLTAPIHSLPVRRTGPVAVQRASGPPPSLTGTRPAHVCTSIQNSQRLSIKSPYIRQNPYFMLYTCIYMYHPFALLERLKRIPLALLFKKNFPCFYRNFIFFFKLKRSKEGVVSFSTEIALTIDAF